MDDHDFPSGPWIGFYSYASAKQDRHRMDWGLTFANGVISGDGTNDIGKFVLRGRYETKSKQVYWTKTYYRPVHEARRDEGDQRAGKSERPDH